ncbi:Uncharacterised protein [Klebsiella pneumoniae]|nr:Uncharacterised protein [Klebsiella pneumoniae]
MVIQHAGLAAGVPVGVERAAKRHITIAVDQRVVAVVQRFHGEIQPLAGGNGRGFAVLRQVVQRGGGNRQRITVDAAAADIVEHRGQNAGVKSVDQAAVVQRLRGRQLGGVGAKLRIRTVLHVGGVNRQQIARLYQRLVVQVTLSGQVKVAAGLHAAAVEEVLPQVEGHIPQRQQAAVTAQAVGAQADVFARLDVARAVDRLLCLRQQVALGTEQPAAVVQRAVKEQRQIVIGQQCAVTIINVLRAQGEVGPLNARAVAPGLAVDDVRRAQRDRLRALDQPAGVVDAGAGRRQGEIAQPLNLPRAVVKVGGGDGERALAADIPGVAVIQPGAEYRQ